MTRLLALTAAVLVLAACNDPAPAPTPVEPPLRPVPAPTFAPNPEFTTPGTPKTLQG